MPMEFNASGVCQSLSLERDRSLFAEDDHLTIEVLCRLYEPSERPSLISCPVSETWRKPYVAYRLGFRERTARPEFQLLFQGDDAPVSVVGDRPVEINQPVHVAATYDGLALRLYVNGRLSGSKPKQGKLHVSNEPSCFGQRSATDPGGFFVGEMHEARVWNTARTAAEIEQWAFLRLPVPAPADCIGLWQA